MPLEAPVTRARGLVSLMCGRFRFGVGTVDPAPVARRGRGTTAGHEKPIARRSPDARSRRTPVPVFRYVTAGAEEPFTPTSGPGDPKASGGHADGDTMVGRP
ncbi:hypothetical protein GCM10010497_26640 [Streptomyces cinereoruber]|uniref:Uncharacterized protein n=1 Tax=Streptomyces cinereoruber TaxID=67260 RepID=A0AAV4KG93_9ACTN|nr:hypothetical protein GCM10010497_26640 [Streptomyces cinereoruber]